MVVLATLFQQSRCIICGNSCLQSHDIRSNAVLLGRSSPLQSSDDQQIQWTDEDGSCVRTHIPISRSVVHVGELCLQNILLSVLIKNAPFFCVVRHVKILEVRNMIICVGRTFAIHFLTECRNYVVVYQKRTLMFTVSHYAICSYRKTLHPWVCQQARTLSLGYTHWFCVSHCAICTF